jgi:hypothetical protein
MTLSPELQTRLIEALKHLCEKDERFRIEDDEDESGAPIQTLFFEDKPLFPIEWIGQDECDFILANLREPRRGLVSLGVEYQKRLPMFVMIYDLEWHTVNCYSTTETELLPAKVEGMIQEVYSQYPRGEK